MKTKFISNKPLLLFFGFLLISISAKSALCVALGNGDWNTAANWSCGAKPACGDSVVIPAAFTVTITSQQDYEACGAGPNVVIYGTLKFDNGFKLKLPCNARIYIMSGGSIKPGTGGGNSNFIEICNDVLWTAGSGTLSGPACLPSTAPWCVGTVLPVELVSFTGDAKDGYVDLNWITATEVNSSHFEIERSVDATSFEKINTVNSLATNGNSNRALAYHAIDNSPIANTSYYRLKQVDRDNSINHSNIISVNYIKAKNVKFVIYPNPNKGEFTADISGIENNHEVQISLSDEKGTVVFNTKFFIQDNTSNKLSIVPETKLPNGLYICTLTLEGIEYNVKVIVS